MTKDAWDVSRMEHEADILRDRITALETENARLRSLLGHASNHLSTTHAYPATGGRHDTLGANFSCGGCALAREIDAALAHPDTIGEA